MAEYSHNDLVAHAPNVSIVIVTWNCKRFIRGCLESIPSALSKLTGEIYVIDNASTDGTTDETRQTGQDVHVIESTANLGFAKANNLGISKSSGKYVCLINPDVLLKPDCIALLWQYMESHPDVGLVGPQLLDWKEIPGRSSMKDLTLWNILSRAMAFDRISWAPRLFKSFLMDSVLYEVPLDVDILNGWFWMARREAIEQIGVLDTRYFMYGEDLDWSRRFRQGGWRVVLCPAAQAIHYGGGSSESVPIKSAIEMERANLQYWRKFHGKQSSLLYTNIRILHHLLRIFAYWLLELSPRSDRTVAAFKKKKSVACLKLLRDQK